MPIRFLDEQPARKPKLRFLDEGPNADQRIEQAFDPSLDVNIDRGGLFPVVRMQRNNGDFVGDAEFDSNAGIVGAIKRAVTLPGDVFSGRTNVTGPDGRTSDEVIGRSFDLAGLAAPVAAGTRSTVTRAIPNKQAVPEDAAQRIQDAQAVGIDLSQGQALRTQKLQAREEDILKGVSGERAQQVLQSQRDTQAGQVDDAISTIQDRIAPGNVETPGEAGDLIRDALTGQAQTLKNQSQRAFDSVDDANPSIQAGALPARPELSQKTLSKVEDFGGVEAGAITTDFPAAARFQKRIDQISNLPNTEGAIPWKAIQNIRSQMVNASKSGDTQAQVIRSMREGLDEFVDDAVLKGLVSGDPKALDSLKQARGLWKQYKGILNNPNAAIRKIAEGSLDGSQVSSLIVGASQVGNKQAGAGIVREIKKLVGKDHQSISELKRGVLTRLMSDSATGGAKTYGKLSSDIMRFTSKDAPELAKELFGQEGLVALRKFAVTLRNLTTDDLAKNPSSSGQAVGRLANNVFRENAGLLGFAVGDLSGIVAGLGLRSLRDTRAVSEARKLSKPSSLPDPAAQADKLVTRRNSPTALRATIPALPIEQLPETSGTIRF